jgi:hypothetical protein
MDGAQDRKEEDRLQDEDGGPGKPWRLPAAVLDQRVKGKADQGQFAVEAVKGQTGHKGHEPGHAQQLRTAVRISRLHDRQFLKSEESVSPPRALQSVAAR